MPCVVRVFGGSTAGGRVPDVRREGEGPLSYEPGRRQLLPYKVRVRIPPSEFR